MPFEVRPSQSCWKTKTARRASSPYMPLGSTPRARCKSSTAWPWLPTLSWLVVVGVQPGYIRVSSLGQNPVRQLEGVKADTVFTDTVSGKSTDRPQLRAMLRFARAGDTIIVHSMDRLARNLEDLRRLVRELTGRGVCVQFMKEQLTFTAEDSPMATLLLSVLGAFAEFERTIRSSASAWSRSSRCAGHPAGRTCYCRSAPACSTTNSPTTSTAGTPTSAEHSTPWRSRRSLPQLVPLLMSRPAPADPLRKGRGWSGPYEWNS
jgi:Resolvase, N terminal domain